MHGEADSPQVERQQVWNDHLARVSHELRTPLNAIIGWAELLRSGRLSGDRFGEALEALLHSAHVQRRLLEDLLDRARIASGTLRMEQRRVDLGAVARSALATLRPAACERRVELELHIGDGVRPVIGDPDRLEQVAGNLVANAIRFSPAGERVTLTIEGTHVAVAVKVRDRGAGIPRGLLPHVFDPFRQGALEPARRSGGLGLGLAIARQIVELHEGTIEAASAGEGEGAEFTVKLPAARDDDDTCARSPASQD